MEQVRVCRFCGQVSPQPVAARCAKCGSFSGLTDLSQVEAAQVTRRHWLRFLRRRSIRWGLIATLLVVLLVWSLRTFFDVGPVPPGATTTLTADLSPQTWAQSRRTLQNAGYTSDQAPVPQVEKWIASSNGPIIAAPAVVGGLVYFIGEDGQARALDTHTGQVVWDYPTGVPSSSAPAVAGDLVFFTLRPGRILALNKATGSLVWEKVFDDPILASPIIADGSLYIGVSDRRLYALDAATGQERWTFASNDWIPSEIAYEDGTVALSSLGGLVHVINAKTGRQRLQYKTGRGRSSAGGPVIQGDLVYFGSYGGRLWAVDRHAWSRPWDRFVLFWKANFYIWGWSGSPAIQRGSVWAVDLGGNVTRTPAVAHGLVYGANDVAKVLAVDAATGDERWTTQLEGKITSAPSVAGNTLLIGTEEGTVFGLDAFTGAVLWDFKTGAKITASPIVVGNTLYVANHDGNLYALTAQ